MADPMNDDSTERPDLSGNARYRSLTDDVQDLRDDAKSIASAEFAYHKARAAYAGKAVVRILLFGLFAVMLVLFAIVALTVGAIIALTPWLGPWGATGAVFGGLVLAALLCGGLAMRRLSHMVRVIGLKGSSR